MSADAMLTREEADKIARFLNEDNNKDVTPEDGMEHVYIVRPSPFQVGFYCIETGIDWADGTSTVLGCLSEKGRVAVFHRMLKAPPRG